MELHLTALMAVQTLRSKPGGILSGLSMRIVTTGTPHISIAFEETPASSHLL
jgi:hypothetical protein